MIRLRGRPRGQALAEFALVFPIFALAFFGAITLGLYVYFQQQITNAAREGARYAAIHSSTAQCPTVSNKDPQAPPLSYFRCDTPSTWPLMTAAATSLAAGLNPSAIHISACWSGYRAPGATGLADDPPLDAVTSSPNDFVQCTIGGIDPVAQAGSIPCPPGTTSTADDPSSDAPGNRVTVYACTVWSPPMAGFLGVPSQVTIRATITEAIQRQQ